MTEEVVTPILSGVKRATLLIFITTGIPPPNRLSHLIEGALILEGNRLLKPFKGQIPSSLSRELSLSFFSSFNNP